MGASSLSNRSWDSIDVVSPMFGEADKLKICGAGEKKLGAKRGYRMDSSSDACIGCWAEPMWALIRGLTRCYTPRERSTERKCLLVLPTIARCLHHRICARDEIIATMMIHQVRESEES